MAFLNNSGDIIVDAVLTDVGREKLARGQSIVSQFALGDTEIDYSLYNSNNSSGSAYYDVSLLQTPIFEPSTYSQTAMGSKLFSYPDNTLQYLPVLKLNQSTRVSNNLTTIDTTDTYAINILASDAIISTIGQSSVVSNTTLIDGRRNVSTFQPSLLSAATTNQGRSNLTTRFIRVGQGFDSQQVTIPLGALEETSFSIYVNRLFLKVIDKNSQYLKNPVILANPFSRTQATDVYKVSVNLDPTYFGDVETYQVSNTTSLATSLQASFLNQVGKELQFSLELSDFLASNPSYYFSTYGQTYGGNLAGVTAIAASMISTFVRVVSDNYGFGIDIPVKIFKDL